jgi:radical SAM superfamily enzyme YgiQ (UPF0313 family)
MAGFIAGFDHDTRESIEEMADRIMEIGIDVPFLSVMTPFRGTPIYQELLKEDRMLEKGWQFYNGYNVAFKPKRLSPEELLLSHRNLWKSAFSILHSVRRILRGLLTLRFGALCLSLFMNSFYMYKRIRKNYPVDMNKHPAPQWEGYVPKTKRTSPPELFTVDFGHQGIVR